MLSNIITTDPDVLKYINKSDFSEAAGALLKEQKKNWRQLSEGYDSLGKVKTKSLA